MAMTYVGSSTPMQGIRMLREVLAEDPKNSLHSLTWVCSPFSRVNMTAIERLVLMIEVNPKHIQGQLLLGVAYMNKGDKARAKQQFERVKQLDSDPSVPSDSRFLS